jgi:tetratricopeptide (TPR) repeat protein
MAKKTRTRHSHNRTGTGITFMTLLIAWTVLPALAAVAGPAVTGDPQLEKAILAQDWERVIRLLPKEVEPNLPAPLRLVKGHACLATNHNNESLCLFLGTSSEIDLRQWAEWSARFLEQHPAHPIAYYFRGDAHGRLGEWDQATADLTEGCRFDPNHALLRNARGVVFAALGQANRAFEDFVIASEKPPHLADAFANLGAYAVQVKDGATGGIRDYDRAIALSPNFALAHFGRGCLRVAMSDCEAGQKDLDNCWTLAECSRPYFLTTLLQARGALADANGTEAVVADAADPGFAVSSRTLDKFARGDFGFNGWDLQNSLMNARDSREIDAITRSVNQGIRIHPEAGPAVARDYDAAQRGVLGRGTLDKTISSWKVNLEAFGAAAAPGGIASGRIGTEFGGQTYRDFSLSAQKFNDLAYSIGKADLRSPNGAPQGFKASPPLGRDRGDWPFSPVYGLAYRLVAHPGNSVAQTPQAKTGGEE